MNDINSFLYQTQRLTGTRKPISIIHPEQFEAFFSYLIDQADMPFWLKAFLGIAMSGGLRVSEVLAIKGIQINHDPKDRRFKTITLKVLKKRRFTTNKQGKKLRANPVKITIRLHDCAYLIVKKYLHVNKIKGNEKLFTVTRDTVYKAIQRYFGEQASPHSIARHSQITWLLSQGKTATQIASMKAMSSAIIDTYAHIDQAIEVADLYKIKMPDANEGYNAFSRDEAEDEDAAKDDDIPQAA